MMKTESTDSSRYETAALCAAGLAVLGLGLGMLVGKPNVGAVLGAGIGLLWRAHIVSSR